MSDSVRAQLLIEIGSAVEMAELRSLRERMQETMLALLPSLPVDLFYKQLNEVHDAIISRVILLAEAELARLGTGSPPVPYAYLLYGSGGREEQTLSSDQDSGIIYANPEPHHDEEEVARYFEILSRLVVERLQDAGYPPCEGEVISSNPQWRHSIGGWQAQLDKWFDEADWEQVRYLLIVADGRKVYGDETLVDQLKNVYYSDMLERPIIVSRMLENTMRHKMLLGVFGQLLKEQYGEEAGSVDIKYGAYIPMVNAIRMLSIQGGLRVTSTLSRIHALRDVGKFSEQEAVEYERAFLLFVEMRLMTTELHENGLYSNNGKLSRRLLTKEMTDKLKVSLRIGKRLQRRVSKQLTKL